MSEPARDPGFEDRARGVLIGLACGDALGRPVEFATPARIEREHGRVTEMLGHGTHGQPAGTLTDDTEMALCIANSLVERGRFDAEDIARRFLAWYERGPFDIGLMTRGSLERIRDGESWNWAGELEWAQRPEGQNAGNGSVMRTGPLAVAYAGEPGRLLTASVDASRITHADPRCTLGCAVLDLTIAAAMQGREAPLAVALDILAELESSVQRTIPVPREATLDLEGGLPRELRSALEGLPGGVAPGQLSNGGYVVDTLQTALYDALQADSAEAAIVTAVNRGGDTDTIGAVAGAVAGARFGASSLPDRWLETLDRRETLADLAVELCSVPDSGKA
jgi:ADP-ribosyl-[dinitrogen reductase] hydrolase